MSLIVAARFKTFEAAQDAATALMNAGIAPDDLHTFFVNPAGAHDRYPVGGDRASDPDSKGGFVGAVAGAALIGVAGAVIGGVVAFAFAGSTLPIVGGAGAGAYIGALLGAIVALGRPRPGRSAQETQDAKMNEGRKSGVLLAVHVAVEQEQQVAQILRTAGGVEVERARGRWQDGKWEDFDPLISPQLETK
ncbi:MAG: hypothetical protein WBF88_19760 [Pusillimonas sp.]